MSNITVDDSGFKAALTEYAKYSRKTMPQILNAKQQDLMFKAGKLTPITTMGNAEYEAQIRKNPAIATYRANKLYGKGGWSKEQRAEIWAKMQKSRLGKAFMKSAFFKAGKKIRHAIATRTGKQSAEPVDNGSPSYADVREATESAMVSTVHAMWKAKSPLDADAKERLVTEPLRQAESECARDMWDYAAKKLGEKGREVSAK